MLATDRGHFSRCNPYMDSPQSIGTSARHSCIAGTLNAAWHQREELTKSFFHQKAIKRPSAPHTWYIFQTLCLFCVSWITSVNGFVCKACFPSAQHAYALELLHDQLYEGAKALDVGSGSGILSACFARMVSRAWRSTRLSLVAFRKI